MNLDLHPKRKTCAPEIEGEKGNPRLCFLNPEYV